MRPYYQVLISAQRCFVIFPALPGGFYASSPSVITGAVDLGATLLLHTARELIEPAVQIDRSITDIDTCT
jgi:hypothetical protein